MQTESIMIETAALTFEEARQHAEDTAKNVLASPMLIAWYDTKKEQGHPDVPECQHQPGWLAYAEGHGGQIRVDVNGGEYSFIFTSGSDNS